MFLAHLALPAAAQYSNPPSGRRVGNRHTANADRIMNQAVQSAGYRPMRASIEAQVKGEAARSPRCRPSGP